MAVVEVNACKRLKDKLIERYKKNNLFFIIGWQTEHFLFQTDG